MQPEELQIIREDPAGPSQPGVVLPATPGVSPPVFPQGGVSRVRRPHRLLPLILQLYQRMDHLNDAMAYHQRMLNHSRHNLSGMGAIVQEIIRISGIDLSDPELGRQCAGNH